MRYDEYRAYDAVGLAGLVARGEVHAGELLELAVERCARVDPAINAVSLLMEENGQELARREVAGPLAGVPFLIKDLAQDYAGFPTSAGTGPLRSVPAREHSIAVRRWLDAGLVIFGKTTTPEFGSKGITETRTFGATRNPWDTDRTPGGSSGGSAAAVAAGIAPVAGASDGGGSIRIPAACTGLFGLKAGRGLIPSGPVLGDPLFGAVSEGVLSRSVRDTAVMFDILSPLDPGAPYAVPRAERPYLDAVTDPVRRLRIGFTHTSPQGTAVDAEAVRAVEDAAALLESLGHTVEPAAPEIDGRRLGMDFMTVWTAWCAAELAEACRETGASTADFDIDTQVLAAVGRAVSSPELLLAHARWTGYTRALAEFHETYDLLLTPSLAEPPLRIGQHRTPAIADTALPPLLRLGVGKVLSRTGFYRDLVTANLAAVPFTQLANITGRPAMSVPTHWTAGGLPLGTQFVGRPGSEYLLLQLAAEIETARPWFDRHPDEAGLLG
ncbi:amidase [Nocardia macrotermitis]|uniref:amidase n=1 Tax=Nocardia macrotermitis TaxID=2585198 RepID=A0A7K0D7Q7_9NOCA|nr:amidase [Nocardia macrotermitis]MQY21796.1 6-aminohexanoate-cyclic-dimer hydrolase [Nocardia macrotermitis]